MYGTDGYKRFHYCFDYASRECRNSEKIGWSCAGRVYAIEDGIRRGSCDQKAAFPISCVDRLHHFRCRQCFSFYMSSLCGSCCLAIVSRTMRAVESGMKYFSDKDGCRPRTSADSLLWRFNEETKLPLFAKDIHWRSVSSDNLFGRRGASKRSKLEALILRTCLRKVHGQSNTNKNRSLDWTMTRSFGTSSHACSNANPNKQSRFSIRRRTSYGVFSDWLFLVRRCWLWRKRCRRRSGTRLSERLRRFMHQTVTLPLQEIEWGPNPPRLIRVITD